MPNAAAPIPDEAPVFPRDLSWLSFNERVLQEAMDTSVPLIERLRFLAIFSSNLDEFYRVRVAALRQLIRLKKKTRKKLGLRPKKLLKEINKTVDRQQEVFGRVFRNDILPGLGKEGIYLVDERELSPAQEAFVAQYFDEKVRHHLHPIWLTDPDCETFLRDRQISFAVELLKDGGSSIALVEIPTDAVPRFLRLPSETGRHDVLFLDDVIRHQLPALFPDHSVNGAFAIKLSRDAELYIEDEYSGNLLEKIRKSLSKRETGVPSRFLFDKAMPVRILDLLRDKLSLESDDFIRGGRYHNFHDFFGFPVPETGFAQLEHPKAEPVPVPDFVGENSIFDVIREKDVLMHFPYQSYEAVIRALDEAADDPRVTRIAITLYRVAGDSGVARALIRAKEAGKDVTVFLEAKARFDEASNLYWYDAMKAAGIQVHSSMPGVKVHAKLFVLERKEVDGPRSYAYLGTGNFNEKSARIYSDFGLLTADPGICGEVWQVFDMLTQPDYRPTFEHLLVAPHEMRPAFEALIDAEIAAAKAGKPAWIRAKMNSLEDAGMIAKLYAASQAGVKIDMVIRGICCLVPGVPGWSENIRIHSILDRYLEHARAYVFHHGGDTQIYLASADWMGRNLSRRIEVGFPLKSAHTHQFATDILDLHFKDTARSRIINERQTNPYKEKQSVRRSNKSIRAQLDSYTYLRKLMNHSTI